MESREGMPQAGIIVGLFNFENDVIVDTTCGFLFTH
jgi:hypothetical protein